MPEALVLKEAIDDRGPYAVWDLLSEDEKKEAAAALWSNADRESRMLLEVSLAKELKFRPQSVRNLSVERVAGRLARMADTLPENVLFQYLFHLHMAGRRPLLTEFLDGVGLPHEEGVLDLAEDQEGPAADAVAEAAAKLVKDHGLQALVYLATLKLADADFWQAVDPVLEGFAADGTAVKGAASKKAPAKKTAAKKPAAKKAAAKKTAAKKPVAKRTTTQRAAPKKMAAQRAAPRNPTAKNK